VYVREFEIYDQTEIYRDRNALRCLFSSGASFLPKLESGMSVLRLFLGNGLLSEQSSSWNFVPLIDHILKWGAARSFAHWRILSGGIFGH
jgi:hypothetical protein